MNCAILLAAGLSHRMGDTNKLLMKDSLGVAMICNSLDQLQKSEIDEIILVTGFQSNKILAAVDAYTFTHAYNSNFKNGQTSSIQAGAVTIPEQCRSFMICLADMPFITSAHYNKILNTFLGKESKINPIIVRPEYHNKPGHPVCFSAIYKDEILSCKESDGCKSVVKNNFSQLIKLDFKDDHFYSDIDTPDDAKNSQYYI